MSRSSWWQRFLPSSAETRNQALEQFLAENLLQPFNLSAFLQSTTRYGLGTELKSKARIWVVEELAPRVKDEEGHVQSILLDTTMAAAGTLAQKYSKEDYQKILRALISFAVDRLWDEAQPAKRAQLVQASGLAEDQLREELKRLLFEKYGAAQPSS
jgi:hypothetical protein